MFEDAGLQKAFRDWLATQPKWVPAASQRVLESAERRLIGSLKRDEPGPRRVANAERVRRAQLGCLKARILAASIPTDIDDEVRQRYLANLSEATNEWETASVDEIIGAYLSKTTPR